MLGKWDLKLTGAKRELADPRNANYQQLAGQTVTLMDIWSRPLSVMSGLGYIQVAYRK